MPGMGKESPHDDVTVTSDVPTRLLPPQLVVAGLSQTSSQSPLDKGKHPSRPHGNDIV